MKACIRNAPRESASSLKAYSSSLFASPRWIEALATDELQSLYIDFIEEEQTVASMAGFSLGKGIRRKMYFYAGPALLRNGDRIGGNGTDTSLSPQDKEILKDCYSSLIRLARKSGYNRVVQLSYDYHLVIPDLARMKFRPRKEYSIALDFPLEELSKRVSRNIRRCVCRATNAGYTVQRIADPGFADEFLQLLGHTREVRLSKGRDDYQSLFLDHLTEEGLSNLVTNGLLHFYVAKKGPEVEGALAVMLEGQKAYGLLKGCSPGCYKLGIPSLLDYSAMEDLLEKGYAYLNLGGVPGGESGKGLHEYKQKLGCRAVLGADGASPFLRFPFSMLNTLVRFSKILPQNKMTRRFSEIW